MEKKLHLWGGSIVLTLMVAGIIAAFNMPREPRKSSDTIVTDSLRAVYDELRIFHGGRINDFDNDRDFDRDGINDAYVMGRDGTVYATHSSDYQQPRTHENLFETKFYKHGKGE